MAKKSGFSETLRRVVFSQKIDFLFQTFQFFSRNWAPQVPPQVPAKCQIWAPQVLPVCQILSPKRQTLTEK